MPEDSTIAGLARGFDLPEDVVRRAASRALAGFTDNGEPLQVDLTSMSDAALVAELRRRLAADTGTRLGTWALGETDMIKLAFAADDAEHLIRDLEYRDETDDIVETLNLLTDFIDSTENLVSTARRVASIGVGGKPRLLELQQQIREATRRRRRKPGPPYTPEPNTLQSTLLDDMREQPLPLHSDSGMPSFDPGRQLAAYDPGEPKKADDDFEGR